MAHDQEIMGPNPGTVYWMDVSNLLTITFKKNLKYRLPNGTQQKKEKF